MSSTTQSSLWSILFPNRTKVQWKAFIATFEKYFTSTFPSSCHPGIDISRILKYSIVLQDEFVSQSGFENFLKLFGPLRLCLVKVCSNLFDNEGILHPWFHGSLSREQSQTILRSLPEGSFLVRLSESQPGKFTIVYVTSDKSLKNVLVYNYQEGGYGLEKKREECSDGRYFDNLPAFLSLHSTKLCHAVESVLYRECLKVGPAVVPRHGCDSNAESTTGTTSATGAPHELSPQDPYGCFGTTGTDISCQSPLASGLECSSGSVDTSPYGFFGEDCVEDGGGRPPPIHVYSTPTTPATTAHFQHIPSEGSECPDDNYGYFSGDLTNGSVPANHLRARSDGEGINISHANSDSSIYPDSLTLRSGFSSTWASGGAGVMGEGSTVQLRRDLSGMLDESCHHEREGDLEKALHLANNVDHMIRSFIENVHTLSSSVPDDSGRPINPLTQHCTESSKDPLLSVPTDDLQLLAKTLLQKGDIQKAMHGDMDVYARSYQESHDVLESIYHRIERSDRGRFEDTQTFIRVHRKLAEVQLCRGNFEKAEYHFAEELSMMLLDSDFELRKVVVKHIQGLVSTYTHNGDSGCCRFCPQANDSDAQDLLDIGISEFKKGPEFYPAASAHFRRAIRASRFCGAEVIEMRALGNLATVESSLGNQHAAVRYYTECVLLCRRLHKDTTLKQMQFKKILCLMDVGLYNKAIACIEELMGIATSLQNIAKLDELKTKAAKSLLARNRF